MSKMLICSTGYFNKIKCSKNFKLAYKKQQDF